MEKMQCIMKTKRGGFPEENCLQRYNRTICDKYSGISVDDFGSSEE